MIDLAYAGAQGQAAGGAGLISFIPLITVFVIFYFLLIRPQVKRQKEHKRMLDNLKRGDRVVTSGGIYGTITKIRNEVVHLEVAEQVRIRVQKSAIASVVKGGDKVSTEQETEEVEDQKKN
ncbi:MAG: preprotein translocase subunit YajC [Nitrospinota bacterium]|nr:MAG: preprotein translocase subunit YajC [Nitrospinota bacterium]